MQVYAAMQGVLKHARDHYKISNLPSYFVSRVLLTMYNVEVGNFVMAKN